MRARMTAGLHFVAFTVLVLSKCTLQRSACEAV